MVPGAGDSTRVQNMKNRLSSDTYPQFWPKQRISSKVCMYQTRGVLDYIWKLLWTLNYWKRNNSSDYLSEDQQEQQLRPEVIKKSQGWEETTLLCILYYISALEVI